MAMVPLMKWAAHEFPWTAASTVHLWAQDPFLHNKGFLAGKVTKRGARYYVEIPTQKTIADEILLKIKGGSKKHG